MSLSGAEPEVGGPGRCGRGRSTSHSWRMLTLASRNWQSTACATTADHPRPGLSSVSGPAGWFVSTCSWGMTQMATCDSSRSKNAHEPRNPYYVPLHTFPVTFRGLGSSHQPSDGSSGNGEADPGLGAPGAVGTGAAAAWERSQSPTRWKCAKETVLAGPPTVCARRAWLRCFSPAREVKAGTFRSSSVLWGSVREHLPYPQVERKGVPRRILELEPAPQPSVSATLGITYPLGPGGGRETNPAPGPCCHTFEEMRYRKVTVRYEALHSINYHHGASLPEGLD